MDDAGVDGMGLPTFGVDFALVEVAVVPSLVMEVDGGRRLFQIQKRRECSLL